MIRTIIQDKRMASALTFNKGLFKKKTVRNFLAVVGSELALRPIQFLKEFVVTKYLGPADYGILKSIELIQMLNKYGTLGFRPAAAREIGDAIGKGDAGKANLVRNTAYSSEVILAIILFCFGLAVSLFFEPPTSILIMLASAGILAGKLRGVLNTEASVQKKFILISKISFVTSLIASIVIIVTVPFLRIYAVISMNVLASVLALIFYFKTLTFEYSFRIDRKEFKRVLRISMPLMVGTLSQGAFKYAERLIVMGMLGMVALGFYGFSFMIVNQFTVLFKAAMKVRTQDIYEALGRKEFRRVNRMVLRETAVLLAGAALLIPVIWVLLGFFIPRFLPRWQEGVFAAQLCLLALPTQVIHNYAIVVLQSTLVNKQKILPVFEFFSTILLIASAYLLSYFEAMTLENFIVVNFSCYAAYSLSVVFLYKRYFYDPYLLKR